MSIKTEITPDYVLNTVELNESLESIINYILKNVMDWKDFHTIWDLREFDFSSLQPDVIRAFVDSVLPKTKIREGLKTAVIVKSDLGYGMMRMFQLISEDKVDIQIQVFKTFEEADSWLKQK